MRPSVKLLAVGLPMGWLLLSCATLPEVSAKGAFFAERLETTVDSDAAKYYLEDYLAGKHSNPELRRRIDALHEHFTAATPARDFLKRVSKAYSVDFASLFFADHLTRNACNRQLNQDFARYLEDERPIDADISNFVILFVPGWDYADNGHLTGADFAQPRRLAAQAGFENYLVPLAPTGSVEENARDVAADIERYAARGKSMIVVGASSAGPAIHYALSELVGEEQQRAVRAWLNLGGILQGSPMVDYFRPWPRRWLLNGVAWFKGWRQDAIWSMATAPSRARFQRLRIKNPGILIVNYVGIPLSGSLSKFGHDKYAKLRDEGPNDGLTLVSDVIAPNSHTIVALGNDHFFAEDPRINQKTKALMRLIVTYLNDGRGQDCQFEAAAATHSSRETVPQR